MNLGSVKAALSNVKTAAGVSLATIMTGLEALPDALVRWAAPIGVVATIVLITVHIVRLYMDWRLYRLKMQEGRSD